jgi:hypothetical protein
MKFEKISSDCSLKQNYFRMVSNFAGERYEFEKCLSKNFTEKQMKASRHGDTVVVQFNEHENGTKTLYKITVDIDSYPKYNFITVDKETFSVIPTKD